jgi:hypothetical protein
MAIDLGSVGQMSCQKMSCRKQRRSAHPSESRKQRREQIEARARIWMNELCRDMQSDSSEMPSHSYHPLVVVSKEVLKVIRPNSIILEGYSRNKSKEVPNGVTQFESVKYVGRNVRDQWNNLSRKNPINLSYIKKHYLTILMSLHELSSEPGVKVIETCNDSSDYVCLAVMKWVKKTRDTTEVDKDFIPLARKVKNNIITKQGAQHFGSTGEYFSFGLKGYYGNNKGISLGEYSSKSSAEAEDNAEYVETTLKRALREACSAIDSVVPCTIAVATSNIKFIREEMSKIEDEDGNKVILPDLTIDGNSLSYSSVNVNCNSGTKICHTENDLTGTLLSALYQAEETNLQFYFQILGRNNKNLWILLSQGTHIYFSAFMLTHRQHLNNPQKNGNINISAYSNQRVYHHFRQTMIRFKQRLENEDEQTQGGSDISSISDSSSSLSRSRAKDILHSFGNFLISSSKDGTGEDMERMVNSFIHAHPEVFS